MSAQTIQLDLPETVYQQIQRAAAKAHRPFNDVLVEAVSAVAPVMEMPPSSFRNALAQMAYLNDAALWQAARATMAPSQRERLEELHDQFQRAGLAAQERQEEQQLLALYRETILVRAQAAVLLKQRGYDVSNLKQFEPLE
ncbi:MAG: hypothetical protein HY741_24350 [Chloroflexi bacterium]|nr:hypothetical protein [Chloroflexota bacterium]